MEARRRTKPEKWAMSAGEELGLVAGLEATELFWCCHPLAHGRFSLLSGRAGRPRCARRIAEDELDAIIMWTSSLDDQPSNQP